MSGQLRVILINLLVDIVIEGNVYCNIPGDLGFFFT
jgi:hypothetical protein